MFLAVRQILSILTFEPKVIEISCNLRCNPHTISNNFAKNQHPLSKMKEEIPLQAIKLLSSLFELKL